MAVSEPERGDGEIGSEMNPKDLEDNDGSSPDTVRSAPAPGVPVSDEEYRRLKKEAEKAPASGEKKGKEVRPNRKE